MKKGRLSRIEQDFIKQNCKRLTYTELATHLQRDVNSIRVFVEKKLGLNITSKEDFTNKAEFDVKRRPYWKSLAQQFSEDELEMFVYHWTRIVSQFKDDILPTEEMQIVNAVKLDIMANRTMIGQYKIQESIGTLESTLMLEKDVDLADRNNDFILQLEQQIATLRAAQDDSSKEYTSLVNRQNSILRDMKSTRDQRLKKIESSKENFSTWMSVLMSNIELRRELGLYMEKNRLAMEQERARLSEYHKYVDGTLDRPILSSDTVTEDDMKGSE